MCPQWLYNIQLAIHLICEVHWTTRIEDDVQTRSTGVQEITNILWPQINEQDLNISAWM